MGTPGRAGRIDGRDRPSASTTAAFCLDPVDFCLEALARRIDTLDRLGR